MKRQLEAFKFETRDEGMTLSDAARDLWVYFQQRKQRGVRLVGICSQSGEILVYATAKTLKGIPQKWESYPVTVVRSGPVTPAA